LKIALLIRDLGYGGSERQLVALAKELHKRQHSVVVVVFYSGGPLEQGLREAGVRLRELNKRGRWDVARFLLHFARVLYEEKPDILYAWSETSNTLATLFKPVLLHTRIVWAVPASNLDFAHYDWLAGLHYKVECRLSRFADLIISNSRSGLDHAVAHGFPRNKMVVIPNGIDTKLFRPDPGARRRVRAEWKVADSEKLVGLVGRLDPMKDHPTFLRAATRLLQEREDVRFVCVGDGPVDYRRELHTLGEDLGLGQHLIWAGVRGDMPAVYNALDIATSSSSFGEGLPNVVGEAMACGVPCVVTDVGDSAWVVGETGVVVPPKDPEALAAGWKVSLARDESEMALKARLRIEENLSLGPLVEQTEKRIWS
jgi:glycosyltransferase involved in cell wall biosynthesis